MKDVTQPIIIQSILAFAFFSDLYCVSAAGEADVRAQGVRSSASTLHGPMTRLASLHAATHSHEICEKIDKCIKENMI